jgi:hypothetical protein
MWYKKKLLFNVDNHINKNIRSHASIPFAFHIENDLFRIFFSSRNEDGKCLPYFIDALVSNGNITLVDTISEPLLNFGNIGTFDDSGIMPSSLIRVGDAIYMYYIGWNEQVSVSYRLSIGLAISYDGGKTFVKYSEGPILDRSYKEPYFNTAPYVILDDYVFKMWYVSCTEWITHNNKTEPLYNIKYCESVNGIDWIKNNITSIDYTDEMEAIGRPCVVKKMDNHYEIYYSYRKSKDYRYNKNNSYKIGSAFSEDGINFKNHNKNIFKNFDLDWDSEMNEYCHIFSHNDINYMLYNGNGFGKNGFGYATNLES